MMQRGNHRLTILKTKQMERIQSKEWHRLVGGKKKKEKKNGEAFCVLSDVDIVSSSST